MFGGMGIIMSFNQGFLMRNFWIKKFKESSLEVWLFLSFAAAFVLMSLGSWSFFILGMLVNVFSQSTLRVVISSRASGIAGPKRRGEVMGIMSSVLSASMVIGPISAGLVFDKHPSLPLLVGAAALLIAFVVMKNCCKKPETGYDQDQIVPEAL
jgi:DHA1 family multidrug resistance protein-like MFS transporter